MSESESLSPGAAANQDFIDNIRVKFPDVQKQVPVNCQDCSTAWLYVYHGRGHDRLAVCPGRSEIDFGETDIGRAVIKICNLPDSKNAQPQR